MNIYPTKSQSTKEIIDISDEQTRNYWAVRLGVTSETLKSAIRAVKNLEFEAILNYLNSRPDQKSLIGA